MMSWPEIYDFKVLLFLETAGARKMLEKDLEVRKIETTYSAMILGRHENHTETLQTCPEAQTRCDSRPACLHPRS